MGGFDRYLAVYDDTVPFNSNQLASHVAALDARRSAGSAAAAALDPKFAQLLRKTLFAWGLGKRGSRMAEDSEFAAALAVAAPLLTPFDGQTIGDKSLPTDVPERLWDLIVGLGVVDNDAKIVAGTKALHHLSRTWSLQWIANGPDGSSPFTHRSGKGSNRGPASCGCSAPSTTSRPRLTWMPR